MVSELRLQIHTSDVCWVC